MKKNISNVPLKKILIYGLGPMKNRGCEALEKRFFDHIDDS